MENGVKFLCDQCAKLISEHYNVKVLSEMKRSKCNACGKTSYGWVVGIVSPKKKKRE